MRRKLLSVILLLIAFSAVFPLIARHNSLTAIAYAYEVKKLEVCGEAVIYAVPDVAVINLGIQKKDKNLITAQTEVSSVLNKIIQMLNSEDIDEKDIQTSNYSVYPDYSYERNISTFIGYNISCSLTVKIRDIKKTGQIIQKATEEGCNTAGGISYEISDDRMHYQQALKLAAIDAQSKAKTLAEGLGIEDYTILSITEKQVGYANIKRMAYSDFAISEINVLSGKIAISACVEVVFIF